MTESDSDSNANPPDYTWKPNFSRRVVDSIFGYDFFISYTWSDGRGYAKALARTLHAEGFECFLDSDDYSTGDDWKRIGYWTLKRTSRLVLVGSVNAHKSSAVLHELRVFSSMQGQIIPISFGGSLDPSLIQSPLNEFVDSTKIRIEEPEQQLVIGPTDAALNELRKTFRIARQSQKRLRFFSVATILFATVACLAIGFWRSSNANFLEAQQRERLGRHEQGIGWLARARSAERNKDYLAAKLMLMKAIGYHSFRRGSVPSNEELLFPDSSEHNNAMCRILAMPNVDLVFATSRESPKGGNRLNQSSQIETPIAPKHNNTVVFSDALAAMVTLDTNDGVKVTVDWVESESNRTVESAIFEWTAAIPEYEPEVIAIHTAKANATVFVVVNSIFSQSIIVFEMGQRWGYELYGMSGTSDDNRAVSSAVSARGDVLVVCEMDQRTGKLGGLIKVYRRDLQQEDYDNLDRPFRSKFIDFGVVENLCLSGDGSLLAGSVGNVVYVWNLEDLRLLNSLSGHRNEVSGIYIGRTISNTRRITAEAGRDVLAWSVPNDSLQTESIAGEDLASEEAFAEEELISPNGELAAVYDPSSGDADGVEAYTLQLQVCDMATRTLILNYRDVSESTYDCISFSQDGKYIVFHDAYSPPDYSGESFWGIPVLRPKRGTDFRSYYSSVGFSETGIVLDVWSENFGADQIRNSSAAK